MPDGRRETQIVKHHGPHPEGHVADPLDQSVRQCRNAPKAISCVGCAGREDSLRPRDLNPEQRQLLPDLIVKLARQAASAFFLDL
jgi:hypothetical protein